MSDAPSDRSPELQAAPWPLLHWQEAGRACSARWRSERGAPAPHSVQLADDSLSADTAYRLACAGTALLWRGDFNNARHLLQAMARRADKAPRRKTRRPAGRASPPDPGVDAAALPAQAFHLHRQAQAQRARILSALLIPVDADCRIPLRRAPDVREACTRAWDEGAASADPPLAPVDGTGASVVSLRELLGLVSANEWRKKGVAVPALGLGEAGRIHPHYGVFSPLRGEYLDLVAKAPLPAALRAGAPAFDIGTGSGVLAALLARRQVAQVVATDLDARALACARANLQRLGLLGQVQLVRADLFPAGQAALVVCNPPWLPARPSAPIEAAVYDEGGRMLHGFLGGLAAHLLPGGEGWLILSDLAEHLQLRSRAELLSNISAAGLQVLGRLDARPLHPKVGDTNDPLHLARAAETTSLWRLGHALHPRLS